jgi:hypothetical protein
VDVPDTYAVAYRRIEEHVIPDKRLGRHFRWDSRSAAYPYLATREEAALADQLWPRKIPILDQGDTGSCTGNAKGGQLGTEPFFSALPSGHAALNEAFARDVLYHLATILDGYPGTWTPDDTGSDGTAVSQGSKQLGLELGYTHATSVQAMADALQHGPVIIGINWYEGFDNPDSSGLVKISGSVRGGHEIVVRGCKIAERRFKPDNSWGTSWGAAGSFEFSWDDMDRLLSEQGDCTVSTPLSGTAPTPIPVPTPDANTAFAAILKETNAKGQEWPDQRHSGYVTTVAHGARTWLNATGL